MYSNQIKLIRKQKGITLAELSDITGISSGYLCHLEKGSRKNPSLSIMEKIAKALNKNISEVFFLQK